MGEKYVIGAITTIAIAISLGAVIMVGVLYQVRGLSFKIRAFS